VEMFSENKFNKKNKEVVILDSDEIEKLIEVCLATGDDGRYMNKYGRVYLFMLCTGLREGEVCGLYKEDIREDGVNVTKTAVTLKIDGKYTTIIQDSPKTNSSERLTPMNSKARELANIILSEFPETECFLYTNQYSVVAPAALNTYFAKVKKQAGITKQGGLHMLRDTFASRLFDADVDLTTISKLLGHSNSKVTENHYIKITNHRKTKAVALIDII